MTAVGWKDKKEWSVDVASNTSHFIISAPSKYFNVVADSSDGSDLISAAVEIPLFTNCFTTCLPIYPDAPPTITRCVDELLTHVTCRTVRIMSR